MIEYVEIASIKVTQEDLERNIEIDGLIESKYRFYANVNCNLFGEEVTMLVVTSDIDIDYFEKIEFTLNEFLKFTASRIPETGVVSV